MLPFTPVRDGAPSAPHPVTCPARHPADHGLVNTQRPALVLYTVTSLADRQARQVEIDNLRFFKEHAMFPPNEPTALFSSVDFAIMSNLNRPAASGQHGVVECGGGGAANVRVFEAPSGPCDLCAEARLVDALGGAEHVARAYEFVTVLNSGVRGPFFTEAAAAPEHRIQRRQQRRREVELNEKRNGRLPSAAPSLPVMTAPVYTLSPPSAKWSIHVTGDLPPGSEKPLPALWMEWIAAYEVNLHDPATDTITALQVRAMLQATLKNSSAISSVPKGERSPEARLFDEKVRRGIESRLNLTRIVDEKLRSGGARAPPGDRKFRCVIRSETHLLKSALEAKLPPEEEGALANAANGTATSTLRRPKLSPAQTALSGYLHEGHFFLHTWKQNQTMVNMGHASVALHRTLKQLMGSVHDVSPCSVVIAKFGGGAWRTSGVPNSTIQDIRRWPVSRATMLRARSP